MTNLKTVGRIGEQYAVDYLLKQGIIILNRNYYCHWGEIDLIGKIDNKIIFYEIKSRIENQSISAVDLIDKSKIIKLLRAIKFYIINNKLFKNKFSLNIIVINLTIDLQLKSIKVYEDYPLGGEL